jgi:hypothetical protein
MDISLAKFEEKIVADPGCQGERHSVLPGSEGERNMHISDE